MQQVIVRKQGRMDYCSWSSRVLTLDPHTGVLLLSKKGNADHIDYHAMQPTHIEVWPHYNEKYVEESFDSLAAKLTIRLAGSAFSSKALRRRHRASRLLNSAGMDGDEAWVLRFTSLEDMRSAVFALERLTQLQSAETSDASFSGAAKVDACATLPASASELLRPIQRAWVMEQAKERERRNVLRLL